MNLKQIKEEVISRSKQLENTIIQNRRHFHMYPETAFEEEQTALFIEKKLAAMGYSTQRAAGTGIIARLKDIKPGKTTALRADMDALNINEENTFPYKSLNTGKMHACGHDAHMASLLGAAQILYDLKEHLPGNIKLIFQPAEEGQAGAKKIVAEGHMRDVDAVFGLHVWTYLPSGMIASRKGAFWAGADKFKISITGQGGHAAAPHKSIDPTAVLVDIYNAIQKIISRELDPFCPAVISTPQFKASHAHNIIPEKAVLEGSFRTMDSETRLHILCRISDIVEGYSRAWRCEGMLEADPDNYPPVHNDPDVYDRADSLLSGLGGITEASPYMVSEDFSFYLEKAPGALILLGMQDEEKGIIHPHHHPQFDIDESKLWKAAALYAQLGFYCMDL